MKKTIASIGLVSVTFLLLIYTDPIWTRYPGGLWIPLIFLLLTVLFFWLIIKLVKELVSLIRNRKSFQWNHLLPTAIIFMVLFFTSFGTFSFDVDERIYGKVIFRACFEGTQNQATFKLRKGNKFEIHWTGVFFYDEFFTGTYRQIGDTLILEYHSNRPVRFGDRILMDNDKKLLRTIRADNDSLMNVVPFYYGYCKGLN